MNKPREKLLIISTSVGRGGADRQLLNLAYELKHRGYPLRIVSLSPLGVMGYEGIDNGLEVSCINLKKRKNFVFGILKIFLLIASWRPKIVLTFLFHASMIGRMARMLFFAQRHISSVRSDRMGGPKREKLFRLTRILDDVTTINARNSADILIKRGVLDRKKTVGSHLSRFDAKLAGCLIYQ